MIKTDDEIDFVKNALAYYQETIAKNKERNIQDNTSINFFNVLIMLKKTKKILEIFNEKVSVRQFYLKRKFQTIYHSITYASLIMTIYSVFNKKKRS